MSMLRRSRCIQTFPTVMVIDPAEKMHFNMDATWARGRDEEDKRRRRSPVNSIARNEETPVKEALKFQSQVFARHDSDAIHTALAGQRTGGWMVEILPFIEQQNLKQDIPIGVPVMNLTQAVFRPPAIYRCPRRAALDDASTNSMWPGHYVLVPAAQGSFMLFDSPISISVPWVSGPEMAYDLVVGSKGPHSDGFYFARGFQQGVSFIRYGQEIR